jgi:hypothetical protein
MHSPQRLALVILLVTGVPAGAAEFIPGWDVEGIWSSNVFRSSDEAIRFVADPFDPAVSIPVVSTIPKEDDFSIRTGPNIRFRDPIGDLTYNLDYQLRYEEFARLDGLGNFEHFVNGNANWAVDDRTQISVANDFVDSESLGAIYDFADALSIDPTITGIRANRQRIQTNVATASVRYRLGPLWEMTFSGDNQLVDYEDELSSDSMSFTGSAQLTRAITRRLILGFGAQVQRADFAGVSFEDATGESFETEDSGTTFYQGFGIVRYQFSRTLRLEANAGPAWSMPDDVTSDVAQASSYVPVDPRTCTLDSDGTPVFSRGGGGPGCGAQSAWRDTLGLVQPIPISPGRLSAPDVFLTNIPSNAEGPEGTLNYFGRIQLVKDWRRWQGQIGLSRSASSSSGLGTSTVVTSYDTLVRWTPSQMWSVTARASLTQQEAASEFRDQLTALRTSNTIVPSLFLGPPVPGSQFLAPCTPGAFQCRLFVADPVGVPFEVRPGDTLDNVIDVETWRVTLDARRRISKNLTADVSASWFQQTRKRTIRPNLAQEFPREDTTQEFRVTIGVTWTFDPIPIPL